MNNESTAGKYVECKHFGIEDKLTAAQAKIEELEAVITKLPTREWEHSLQMTLKEYVARIKELEATQEKEIMTLTPKDIDKIMDAVFEGYTTPSVDNINDPYKDYLLKEISKHSLHGTLLDKCNETRCKELMSVAQYLLFMERKSTP